MKHLPSIIESLEAGADPVPTVVYPVIYKKEGTRHNVRINQEELVNFLNFSGYRGVEIGGQMILIKMSGRVINDLFEYEVARFIDYYTKKNLGLRFLFRPVEYRNFSYSEFETCLESLDKIELHVKRSSRLSAFFYYANGVVEVEKESIRLPMCFEAFDGLIWGSKIIKRRFREVRGRSVFETFCGLISDLDNKKFEYLCSLLGYLMHAHRKQQRSKAVIFCDENAKHDYYGSEVHITLSKAIRQIRTVGVNTSYRDNDPNKAVFRTDLIFEKIDLLETEAYGGKFDPIQISDPSSLWQIYIHYGGEIGGRHITVSPSDPRLQNVIFLSGNPKLSKTDEFYLFHVGDYFSDEHTPEREFGHELFKDWNEVEWNKFDTFMLQCVQLYLRRGIIDLDD